MVISLKKYLDMNGEEPKEPLPDPGELLPLVLAGYRLALLTMGKAAVQGCATVSNDLQQNLVGLEAILASQLTPALLKATETKVEEELNKWGGRTADYFKAKANEVKELLIVLAKTAESVGERDHRYASRFTELTAQLHTIADLEDIGQVRTS